MAMTIDSSGVSQAGLRFASPLLTGIFLRRYKRFFADVQLDDGRTLAVHCANTGTMRGCSTPGCRAAISLADRPGRTLPGTLELVEVAGRWVGVHPARANAVVAAGCADGAVPEWSGATLARREVRVPGCESRFDLELRDADGGRRFVEIKSVSWVEDGEGRFPDAKSVRARRHADELSALARAGERVTLFFCVQRDDARVVVPAWDVDADYGHALRRAASDGVQLLAYGCSVTTAGLALARGLPVVVGV